MLNGNAQRHIGTGSRAAARWLVARACCAGCPEGWALNRAGQPRISLLPPAVSAVRWSGIWRGMRAARARGSNWQILLICRLIEDMTDRIDTLRMGTLVRERPFAGFDFCTPSRGRSKALLLHNRRLCSVKAIGASVSFQR